MRCIRNGVCVRVQKKKISESKILTICQMSVKNIENDGEMSVYGTAGHNGTLILTVEAGSEAEKRGLFVNDVIVAWGNQVINCVDDLTGCSLDPQTPVAVFRKQRRIVL